MPAPNGASPSPAIRRGRSKKNKSPWVVFFFLLWPRAGAQRGFFFPCLSPWPEQKKNNTLGGVFFLALAPCRRPTELLLPLPSAAVKKTHTLGGVYFFALAPCRRPTALLLPLPFSGAGAKKKHPGFLLWPRAGAQRGFSFPCLAPGPEQKKHPGWVFFFILLWPRAGAQGRIKKKNTLGGVFFFALAPCRRPTKLLLPLPFPGAGAKKKKHPGWCFFLLWPRAGAQGRSKKKHPGWCLFFALAPCRRPTKLLLPLPFPGAGAKKKKNTPWVVFFFCSGPVPAPNEASPSPAFPRGRSKKKTPWVVFVFLLWPRAGAQGRSKKKHPVFFLLWPRAGAQRRFSFPCLSPGPEQKKKHPGFLLWPRAGAQRGFSFPCLSPGPEQRKTPWVFFFILLWPRAGAQGRIKKKTPWVVFFFLLWPRAGAQRSFSFPCLSPGPEQKKKKTHPGWCIFFCSGPVPAPNGASPSLAFGRSKKKHTPWVVFIFLLWPRAGAQRRFSFPCLSPGPEQKKKHPGFLLWPRAGAQRGFSFPCLSPGPEQRKTPWVFFFILLWPRAGAQGRIKKKTPWVVFFFLLWPRAGAQRSFSFPCLSPGPEQKKKNTLGGVFFFALAPCRRPRPEQKKSPWVVFIFCSGPVPAPNEASPSPAFPRGRSKKKKKHTLGGVFFFALAPCRRPTKLLLPLPFPGAGAKKNHPGWCLFFCSGPVPAPKAGAKNNTLGGVFLLWPRAGAQRSFSFPCLLPRGRSKKKNTLGGVFFFLLWPRAGAQGRSKKTKHPGWCFFFCSGPVPAPNGASPSPAFPRGRSKKKKNNTLGGVFFCSGPTEAPNGLLLPLPFPGAGEKKQHPGWWFFFCSGPVPAPKAGAKKKTPWVVFFFLLWPRAGAQRGFSFPCLSPGPEQKKKHPGWCFFFCSGPAEAPNGAQQKKKHPDLTTDPKLVAFPSQKSRCINPIWTPRVCRIKAFYQDPPMAL